MQIVKWFILTLLCFTFNNEAFCQPVSITEIPPSGMVISAPGTYVLENDITWAPTGDGQAILILAKNVTLDLQTYTLRSETTNFNTTGIRAIASENLTIKNGTIANLALGGIECTGCTNVVIKHITVDGLNKQNTVLYTVPFGILVDLTNTALVHKCNVKNVDVRTGSVAAIQMTATLSSKISKCQINNMINRDGACTGIGHLLCDMAEIKSCTLDNIQTEFIDNLNTEGHTAIGIIPFISKNLVIKDCKVSNVVGCCDDAHGISVFECQSAIVKDCTVENVLDGAGPAQTGAKATGIEIYASFVKVSNCSVKNITAINPQDRQATGFSCAQCFGVEFIWCTAENVNVVDQFGNHNPGLGYGTGFGWAPDPRIVEPAVNILYQYCTAKRCQVGFDSWFHIDSTWKSIVSECNPIAVLNLSNYQRTLSCDPCSECGCTQIGCYPTPFSITLDNVASNNTFKKVTKIYCAQ